MVMPEEPIADFSLPATGGGGFSLSAWRGRIIVLYFYPKDSSPGCTDEALQFRELHPEFQAAGADVFGLSRDSLKAHEKFRAKQDLPFDLLSDPDGCVCKQFDVLKTKKLYGREVCGIERSTFVLDRTGRLCRFWRGVRLPGHASEVLEFIKTL